MLRLRLRKESKLLKIYNLAKLLLKKVKNIKKIPINIEMPKRMPTVQKQKLKN
jgi:hypothetical protein